jgi:hypothetical protein
MAASRIVNYGPEHFEGAKALWREAVPNDPQWSAATAQGVPSLPSSPVRHEQGLRG